MPITTSVSITENYWSAVTNSSNVTVKIVAKWTGTAYDWQNRSGSYCTINGTKYAFVAPDINPNRTTSGSKTIYSKTLNIAHGSDGTKKLTVSYKFERNPLADQTGSATKTLTKVARPSTLSFSNSVINVGSNVTFNVTANLASTVTYIYVDGVKYATLSGTSSATVAIKSDMLHKFGPAATTYNATIEALTYNYAEGQPGATALKKSCIATKVYTLHVGLPSGYTPIIQAPTLTKYPTYYTLTKPVVTGQLGASIASITVTADAGATVTTYSNYYTITPAAGYEGSILVTFRVTDSRGRVSVYTYTITGVYMSTCYVYTSAGWKLAVPYVYTSAGWKQSVNKTYYNSAWR